MAANPEPDKSVGRLDGQGSVVSAHAQQTGNGRPSLSEAKDAEDLASGARHLDVAEQLWQTRP